MGSSCRRLCAALSGRSLGGVLSLAFAFMMFVTGAYAGTVTTIAGTGVAGFSGDGGPALAAMLHTPRGVAVAADGTVYVMDASNFRVRRIGIDGVITTVAGNGGSNINNLGLGGPATESELSGIGGIALDPTGTRLYIGLLENSCVVQVDLASGIISGFAGFGGFGSSGDGGPAFNASFSLVGGVAVDGAGNVYIADILGNSVRKVDIATGIIDTVAGGQYAPGGAGDGGPATAAAFDGVDDIAVDAVGNLYINNLWSTVRRVDATTGIIDTVAGGGTEIPVLGAATSMNLDVRSLAVDAAGDLYIGSLNGQIFKVDIETGLLTVFAGTGIAGFGGDGGPATAAMFSLIGGMGFGPSDVLVVGDMDTARVRSIQPDPVATPFDLNITPATAQALLDAVTNIDGSVILIEMDGRAILLIPNLASVGLDVTLQGNDQLLAIDLGALANVGGSIDVSGNLALSTLDLGVLADVGGNLHVADNPNLSAVLISGVTHIGGNLSIIGSAATAISLPALANVDGSVSVADNTVATSVDLGSLVNVGVSLDVNGNTAATVVDIGSLQNVGGSVDVNGNTAATTVDLGQLASVGTSVSVNGNESATVVDLSALASVGTSVDVNSNTAATVVDLSSLASVGASVSVNGNTSATVVDLSQLDSVGTSVDVNGNTAATVVDLGSLASVGTSVNVNGNSAATVVDLNQLATVGGSVNVNGNASASVVDLGSLATVDGSVDVTANGPTTTVDLGSLTTVTGDVAVESTGTGTFDAAPVAVGGNTNLMLDGYDAVSATTAAGTTDVSNATTDTVMHLHIQSATFTTPVGFTATRLDALTLVPESGTSAEGVATVDPIAAYQFAFDIPTLGREATLSFEVTLAGLDAATQQALLDGLAAGTATLATKGDAAGSSYQAFPLCSGSTVPTIDGCVLVEMFDANGNPITSGTPASVRFSNVVGHFSVWAVAIVTPQGSGGDTGGEDGQGEPCPPLSADACLDDTGYDLVSYHRFTLSDGVPGIQEVDFGAHAGAGMVVVRNYGCAAAQTRLNDDHLSQPAAQVPLPPCSSQAVTLKDYNRLGIELSGEAECTVKVAIVAPAVCRVSSVE